MRTLSLPEDASPRADVRIRHARERHSGGAWKVAYADFVTALMALFIVLWLMNASQKVRSSVAGYFTDPRGFARTQEARPVSNSGEGLIVHRDNLGNIRRQLQDAMEAMPEFQKMRDQVKFSMTGEGLRIDLLETEQGIFFVSGSAAPTPEGRGLLVVLAREMSQLPNLLVIEGHTDARPFRNATPTEGYSNWELASDRANAARRLLHGFGVRPA